MTDGEVDVFEGVPEDERSRLEFERGLVIPTDNSARPEDGEQPPEIEE